MKKVFLALTLTAITTGLSAQSFYVGGALGVSQNKLWVNPELADNGITMSQDKSSTAAKAIIGYNLNKTFAIEAQYVDLGKNKTTYNDNGDVENWQSKVKATTLAIKANVAQFDQLTPFVKLGVGRVENKENGPAETFKKSETNLYWGLGADYEINKTVSLRAEYENYGKTGSFDTATIANSATGTKSSSLTLGVIYKF